MISNWRFSAAVAVVLAAAAAAQETAPAKTDLAKAQQTATQICAACHGPDGNSATSANPNLAGQHADYITVQLAHFKAGIRVNAIMQGMVANLSDDNIRALGVYFSQQKPRGLTAKDPALVKVGQKIYGGGDQARERPACAPNRSSISRRIARAASRRSAALSLSALVARISTGLPDGIKPSSSA